MGFTIGADHMLLHCGADLTGSFVVQTISGRGPLAEVGILAIGTGDVLVHSGTNRAGTLIALAVCRQHPLTAMCILAIGAGDVLLHGGADGTGALIALAVSGQGPLGAGGVAAIGGDDVLMGALADAACTLIGSAVCCYSPLGAGGIIAIGVDHVGHHLTANGTAGGVRRVFRVHDPLPCRIHIAILAHQVGFGQHTVGAFAGHGSAIRGQRPLGEAVLAQRRINVDIAGQESPFSAGNQRGIRHGCEQIILRSGIPPAHMIAVLLDHDVQILGQRVQALGGLHDSQIGIHAGGIILLVDGIAVFIVGIPNHLTSGNQLQDGNAEMLIQQIDQDHRAILTSEMVVAVGAQDDGHFQLGGLHGVSALRVYADEEITGCAIALRHGYAAFCNGVQIFSGQGSLAIVNNGQLTLVKGQCVQKHISGHGIINAVQLGNIHSRNAGDHTAQLCHLDQHQRMHAGEVQRLEHSIAGHMGHIGRLGQVGGTGEGIDNTIRHTEHGQNGTADIIGRVNTDDIGLSQLCHFQGKHIVFHAGGVGGRLSSGLPVFHQCAGLVGVDLVGAGLGGFKEEIGQIQRPGFHVGAADLHKVRIIGRAGGGGLDLTGSITDTGSHLNGDCGSVRRQLQACLVIAHIGILENQFYTVITLHQGGNCHAFRSCNHHRIGAAIGRIEPDNHLCKGLAAAIHHGYRVGNHGAALVIFQNDGHVGAHAEGILIFLNRVSQRRYHRSHIVAGRQFEHGIAVFVGDGKACAYRDHRTLYRQAVMVLHVDGIGDLLLLIELDSHFPFGIIRR